ncbi:hypothetical protein [Singulisphaera sp. PoT]|uniref:hypothetical protein n=1 Tax=Singulisphaera sp. PoT TaxID=3411797 RepID=UPI003BF57C18
MNDLPSNALALVMRRLEALEYKTDGVFALAFALFEILLDKKCISIEDVTEKLGAVYDVMDEPWKSAPTGIVVHSTLKVLRDSRNQNPAASKKAILELIRGGRDQPPGKGD